jgi:hypothetical protein
LRRTVAAKSVPLRVQRRDVSRGARNKGVLGGRELFGHLRILFHPPEQIGVVQHDAVFVYAKLRAVATAVEVLEEVEPVGQPRIGLRLRANRQVRRVDPGHAKLPPLTDSHRLTANREAVGKGRWPDIDIQAAVELVDVPAIAVSPVAQAVRLQSQRSGGPFCVEYQFGIAELPRFVPG